MEILIVSYVHWEREKNKMHDVSPGDELQDMPTNQKPTTMLGNMTKQGTNEKEE